MSGIIDLQELRDKRNAPDDRHVVVVVEDGRPVKWFEFGVEFSAADGRAYSFNIWARSIEHAEQQLQAIKQSAAVVGQIYATVEV